MATTYKSTVEVNVWKEHACIGCGSRFRYLFKRKKTGSGGSSEAASAAARKAVLNALQNEVDMHPCPSCGLYQPDMVGSQRWTRHLWLILASAAVLLLVLILTLTDVMTRGTAAWTAAGVCGLLALGHWLIDRSNPNRDLERNHQQAQRKVEGGDLWVPPGSKAQAESSEPPRFGWSTAHTVAYILLGLGLLALASPELLRLVHGWPANKEWYPLAAGPGDEPYVYFPSSITSVKGYWQANATAVVLNANEIGLAAPQLRATSQNDKWGDTIRIGSKESKTSSKTLWVRVALPMDKQLEDKTLTIKMALDVTYPQLQGNQWEPVSGHYEHTQDIRLGGAGAGGRYRVWWGGGYFGGVLLLAVSSLLLLRLSTGLRKLAQPTSIFTPGEGEQEKDVPEVLPADQPRRDEDEDIVRREG
ncbi:MAG TPA: hypothetical protein VH682_28980 [Gemmataceae bacterium]